MKKIYLRESQISEELLLPKFLFKAVIDHRTSLGNNPAFPEEDDFPFDYAVLKERFKDVCLQMKDIGIPLGNKGELTSELGAMVKEARELEKPIKDSLEKLCENAVNRLFAIPEDAVNLKCVLVDKIKPDIAVNVTPEDSSGKKFKFKDIKDFGLSKKAIAKRRLINSLIMGASEYYTSMVSLYQEDLNKLNPDLLPLYDRIMVLNRYLTFITNEEISDKNQKQGSFVEVHVGSNGKKNTINAQGIIFPLLLHDTIKGFFELFSVYGLPLDGQKATHIVSKSDFLLAEPWDMRFGGKLWQLIFDRMELADDTNIIPYVFMELVKLPADDFNQIMQEVFMGTERGDEIMGKFIEKSRYNDGYQKFKNRINARNLNKSIIADSYFTASELYGYDIDSDDDDGEVIEEVDVNNSKNVIYYGIFLDEESKDKLRDLVPENAYKIYCDHMTLAHSSVFNDDVIRKCESMLGKEFTMTATTIGVSDDAVAVGVETDCFSVNEHKHITLCTMTPKSKPVQSNYIDRWDRLRKPIMLRGVVMGYTKNGLISG